MDAKTLRLGNIVRSKTNGIGKVEQVGSSINSNYVEGRSIDGNYWENSFLPVEITPKWLIDFGFTPKTKLSGHNGFYLDGWYLIKEKDIYQFIPAGSSQIMKEIKYLHELQNLFFAITGRELELKDKT